MERSLGPGAKTKFDVDRAVSNALIQHTEYVSKLRLWDQFLIWRYTLGSGSLNATLIGIATDEQIMYWTYIMFVSYNYNTRHVDKKFKKYKRFFENPKTYLEDENRINIAKIIVREVIVQLERVILKAPVIELPFEVYKASTLYPGLQDATSNPKVTQFPFNSTTYNPQFNFAPFIAEDASCCLHRITIPKGSRVLMIPAEFHAYPHEMECLLPFGSTFDVQSIEDVWLDYIPKEQQGFIRVQDPKKLFIGQVYMVDPVSNNQVKRKKMRYYISILV